MESTSDGRLDLMGEFHNQIVKLIDESKLTPVETIAVLHFISDEIKHLFELSVKGKKD